MLNFTVSPSMFQSRPGKLRRESKAPESPVYSNLSDSSLAKNKTVGLTRGGSIVQEMGFWKENERNLISLRHNPMAVFWALLTRARFHMIIWGSQRSSRKHSALQFSPSCSSWDCSLKWSKLVKTLEFSSFTLLGQSFCGVPAHRFLWFSQMLRAPEPGLWRTPSKGNTTVWITATPKWSQPERPSGLVLPVRSLDCEEPSDGSQHWHQHNVILKPVIKAK